jgi:hypothetical protein
MARSVKEQIGVDLPDPVTPQAVDPQQESGEASAEESRPAWLPDNFKSPEDLARSYQEAQNRIREQAEQQKNLELRLNALTEAVSSQQFTNEQQPSSASTEQITAAFESDPLGTMAWLAQQIANNTVEERIGQFQNQISPQLQANMQAQNDMLAITADQQLGNRYADWGEYKSKVAQAIESDPTLLPDLSLTTPDQTINALDRVYRFIKAEEIMQRVESGDFNPDISAMKQRAQSMSGSTGRPGETSYQDAKIEALKAAASTSSYSAFRG